MMLLLIIISLLLLCTKQGSGTNDPENEDNSTCKLNITRASSIILFQYIREPQPGESLLNELLILPQQYYNNPILHNGFSLYAICYTHYSTGPEVKNAIVKANYERANRIEQRQRKREAIANAISATKNATEAKNTTAESAAIAAIAANDTTNTTEVLNRATVTANISLFSNLSAIIARKNCTEAQKKTEIAKKELKTAISENSTAKDELDQAKTNLTNANNTGIMNINNATSELNDAKRDLALKGGVLTEKITKLNCTIDEQKAAEEANRTASDRAITSQNKLSTLTKQSAEANNTERNLTSLSQAQSTLCTTKRGIFRSLEQNKNKAEGTKEEALTQLNKIPTLSDASKLQAIVLAEPKVAETVQNYKNLANNYKTIANGDEAATSTVGALENRVSGLKNAVNNIGDPTDRDKRIKEYHEAMKPLGDTPISRIQSSHNAQYNQANKLLTEAKNGIPTKTYRETATKMLEGLEIVYKIYDSKLQTLKNSHGSRAKRYFVKTKHQLEAFLTALSTIVNTLKGCIKEDDTVKAEPCLDNIQPFFKELGPNCDLIVNRKNDDNTNADAANSWLEDLQPEMFVMDLIYKPIQTLYDKFKAIVHELNFENRIETASIDAKGIVQDAINDVNIYYNKAKKIVDDICDEATKLATKLNAANSNVSTLIGLMIQANTNSTTDTKTAQIAATNLTNARTAKGIANKDFEKAQNESNSAAQVVEDKNKTLINFIKQNKTAFEDATDNLNKKRKKYNQTEQNVIDKQNEKEKKELAEIEPCNNANFAEQKASQDAAIARQAVQKAANVANATAIKAEKAAKDAHEAAIIILIAGTNAEAAGKGEQAKIDAKIAVQQSTESDKAAEKVRDATNKAAQEAFYGDPVKAALAALEAISQAIIIANCAKKVAATKIDDAHFEPPTSSEVANSASDAAFPDDGNDDIEPTDEAAINCKNGTLSFKYGKNKIDMIPSCNTTHKFDVFEKTEFESLCKTYFYVIGLNISGTIITFAESCFDVIQNKVHFIHYVQTQNNPLAISYIMPNFEDKDDELYINDWNFKEKKYRTLRSVPINSLSNKQLIRRKKAIYILLNTTVEKTLYKRAFIPVQYLQPFYIDIKNALQKSIGDQADILSFYLADLFPPNTFAPYITNVFHNLKFLQSFIGWKNLVNGNWKTLHKLLSRRIFQLRNSDIMYDIYVGTSHIAEAVIPDCNYLKELGIKVNEKLIPIPKYIWMYLNSEQTNEDFVIIGINSPYNPFFANSDIFFCDDICDKIIWMKPLNIIRKINTFGRIFCCERNQTETFLNGFPVRRTMTSSEIN